jgi:hypothetical protein
MYEAERFWAAFETETGEHVVGRTIGIWHESGMAKGVWGLVILTDRSFRYKYMPSQSLILGLFRAPNGNSPAREEIDIVMPLEQIRSIKEQERGWFSRFFGSPFPRVSITWGPSEAERRSEDFSIDPSTGLVEKLKNTILK